jgi:hypothetical protein
MRQIVEKMLMPLHGAITSYMIGNYYGTIALCGLVCEMLSIFLFEISELKINDQPVDESKQEQLFGGPFEGLRAERRIDVLRAYGVLGEEHSARLHEVRRLRNRHLHLLSHDGQSLPEDAKRCFLCTMQIFEVVFRVEPKEGMLMLRSQVVKYVRAKGVAKSSDDLLPKED